MKKIFVSILMTLTLLTLATGTVFAQTESVTGTVETIEFGTDADGETIVILTLTDQAEPVQVSVETAELLGLVTVDPVSGDASATDTAVGSEVTVEPEDIIPGDGEGEEESEHPVGSALSEFFSEMLGVDYDTIMEQHDDGFGFGVIAQALWLTNQIEGDSETFVALLEAKESGDYSNITLADGSTPDNWGDVVKSLKKGEKLGSVMSDKGSDSDTEDGEEKGKGKDKGKDKDKGDKGNKGNGNGNGNGNPNNDD
jgi:hypothetical protein